MGARALIIRGDIPKADTIEPRSRMAQRQLNRGNPRAFGVAPWRSFPAARLPKAGDTAKRALMSRFSIKLTIARIIGPVA
jgi:hypothetical protein